MVKWQQIAGYGSVSVFLLIVLITNLSGISDVKYSKDYFCTDCEGYVNFTSSYWEFCFEHSDKDVVYKKQILSRRLWINMDKINKLVPTQPEIEINLQVPTTGNKWRDIKEGDCLKRTTASNPLPIRLKIVGNKSIDQTVKWGFDLDHWSSEGIYIDPIWMGLNIEILRECTNKTDIWEVGVFGTCTTEKEAIYYNNISFTQSTFTTYFNYSCEKSKRLQYINSTVCINQGFSIDGRILNFSKYSWKKCSRDNFRICCEAEHQSNGDGLCKSGEGYCVFNILDLRNPTCTVSKTKAIRELKIE